MKKLFFITGFMVVGLLLEVGVSFATDSWKPTGPTAEDILSATKVENLAAKGSREEKLISAVKSGDLKDVDASIAAGAGLEARDNQNMTPLMIAAKKGFTDIASKLINAGANVNARDFNATIIFHAADKGHANIVRILIAAGANDPDFESIFMSAVFKGNTEMVKALAANDANISCDTLHTAYMMANKRNTELVNIIKHLKSQCDNSKIAD